MVSTVTVYKAHAHGSPLGGPSVDGGVIRRARRLCMMRARGHQGGHHGSVGSVKWDHHHLLDPSSTVYGSIGGVAWTPQCPQPRRSSWSRCARDSKRGGAHGIQTFNNIFRRLLRVPAYVIKYRPTSWICKSWKRTACLCPFCDRSFCEEPNQIVVAGLCGFSLRRTVWRGRKRAKKKKRRAAEQRSA